MEITGLRCAGRAFRRARYSECSCFWSRYGTKNGIGSQGILIDGAPEQKEKYLSLALPVQSERSLLPSPSLMRVQTPPIPDEGGKEGGFLPPQRVEKSYWVNVWDRLRWILDMSRWIIRGKRFQLKKIKLNISISYIRKYFPWFHKKSSWQNVF